MRQTVDSPEQAPPDQLIWWTPARYPAERASASAERPGWAELVETVLSTMPEAGEPPAPFAGTEGERTLLHPLRPFLAATFQRVESDFAGVDLYAVWSGVEAWLAGRLSALAARTLVRELHTTKRAGLLRGKTSEDRFADFLRLYSGRVVLADLFDRYPVLARLLAETCLNTADAVVELLDRFAADRADIAGLLTGEPGALVDVTLGSGDVHVGGRAVAILTFENGQQLVYKPRPLGLQARWGTLLEWFAAIQPELAPRGVRVLAREGYGWAEFVPAVPCADQGQVDLFYRRQGALLALLYALDATDMHCENLIAIADEPMLVDVETLFHPVWARTTQNGPDPAMAALDRSVVRTALLPTLLLGEHGSLDVSAFGGESADYPAELPRWTGAGTDAMRLVRGRLPYSGGANRPVLDGDAVDANLYRQSLLSGFRVAYESLVARSGELTEVLAGFAAEEIRLVMRPTQVYALLLADSTHPDHLVDGAARERAFASQAGESAEAHQRPLAGHEIAELCAGDVPLFTTSAGSTDVFTQGGHRLPGLLAASGIDRALAKIAQLSPVDLREQEWLVEATLATKQRRVSHAGGEPLPGSVAAVVPDSQHLLALASGIGDDFVARSAQDDVRANWLGLELVDGRHWMVLPMGAGLAEGYIGTALFLAQLGNLTGTSRYSELAAKAVRTLPMLVDVLANHPELAREVGPGGFSGLGGICYAIARISTLLGDRDLAACLPAAIAATASADTGASAGVGEGTAGALAAMLAVHAETGLPEAAALAATLAANLRSRPLPAEPGFLWGGAGVDWALGRGERVLAATPDPAAGLGWCSGLAGTVLAAHTAGVSGADLRATLLADGFAAAVADRPPARDQSLCHGELGTLEALVVLAGQGHEHSAFALRRASARLIGAIEQHGLYCGTPGGVPSPGLFTGTGGIGFGLLRVGFAERVPSVLLLRPSGMNELHNN